MTSAQMMRLGAVLQSMGLGAEGVAAKRGFHDHLDACRQCEQHPFDLCPIGAALLVAEVQSDPLHAKCPACGAVVAFTFIGVQEPGGIKLWNCPACGSTRRFDR